MFELLQSADIQASVNAAPFDPTHQFARLTARGKALLIPTTGTLSLAIR